MPERRQSRLSYKTVKAKYKTVKAKNKTVKAKNKTVYLDSEAGARVLSGAVKLAAAQWQDARLHARHAAPCVVQQILLWPFQVTRL